MAKAPDSDSYNGRESSRRRDDTLLRMLKMPPKPHREMKLGKPKGKRAKSPGDEGAFAKR